MIHFMDTVLSNVSVNTTGDFSLFTITTIEKKDNTVAFNTTENITLPVSLKMSWSGTNDGIITIAVLKNLTSFNKTDQIKSQVVILHDSKFSVTSNIEVNFTFIVKHYNTSEGKIGCYHQNKTNLIWENTYCKVIKVNIRSYNISISCTCNHLTSFAVLFNPYGTSADSFEITLLSVILSCISLLSSLVSMVIYLKLWIIKKRNLILIIKCSVCFSVAISYSIFIVTQTHIGIQVPCLVNGILNHYTVMSYYLSIFLLSAVITLMILKPFYKLKLKILFSLIAMTYLLPASLSVIFGIFLHNFYKTCSVQGILRHLSITMLGAFILVFNIYSFIYLYSVSIKKIEEKSIHKKNAKKLKIAFTLVIFFGIPLFLQYILFKELQPAIDYIFNIFNLLQGFFILILAIATETKWLKRMRRKEYKIASRKSYDYSSTSGTQTLISVFRRH